MKKIISMLVLIAMLTASLVACGGGNGPAETTPADNNAETTLSDSSNAETTEYMAAKDLGGYVLRYLHGNRTTGIVPDDEEDQNSVVVQAKIKRDAEIKDKFNIDFADVAYGESDQITSYVLKDAMGTEATFDVGGLMNGENIMTMVSQNILMDINEMPYMDLSQDWYGGEAIKAFEVMGKQHYFTSAFPGLPGCAKFLFNKNMMDELGLEYPYETILEGGWTIELLEEYTSAAYVDIDGVAGPSGMDRFGYNGHDQSVAYFYLGMGGITSTKDENGALVPVLSNPTVDMIYSKIQNFYKNPNHWMNSSLNADDATSSHRVFYDGRALFCFWITSTLEYSEIESFEYGLSILPKYDEDQERYYCFTSGACLIMPGNMADPETVGYLYEALAEASWRIVYPAGIQEAQQYELLPDEESIMVQNLIDRSLTYDVLRKLDPSGGQLAYCSFILHCMKNNTTPSVAAAGIKDSIEKMFSDFFYPAG